MSAWRPPCAPGRDRAAGLRFLPDSAATATVMDAPSATHRPLRPVTSGARCALAFLFRWLGSPLDAPQGQPLHADDGEGRLGRPPTQGLWLRDTAGGSMLLCLAAPVPRRGPGLSSGCGRSGRARGRSAAGCCLDAGPRNPLSPLHIPEGTAGPQSSRSDAAGTAHIACRHRGVQDRHAQRLRC
jgi:hypothetical protein